MAPEHASGSDGAEADVLDEASQKRIDEHGEHDRWGRGGVYDENGDLDRDATESLLADRFSDNVGELPETVGDFERIKPDPVDQDEATEVLYERTGDGALFPRKVVRVFPRRSHLNNWTVSVRQHGTLGQTSQHLDGATDLNDPQAAVEAAIEYMEGQ